MPTVIQTFGLGSSSHLPELVILPQQGSRSYIRRFACKLGTAFEGVVVLLRGSERRIETGVCAAEVEQMNTGEAPMISVWRVGAERGRSRCYFWKAVSKRRGGSEGRAGGF